MAFNLDDLKVNVNYDNPPTPLADLEKNYNTKALNTILAKGAVLDILKHFNITNTQAITNSNFTTLSDTIAALRSNGYTSQTIVDYLNSDAAPSTVKITGFLDDKLTVSDLRAFNNAEAPATYQNIINKINKDNPNANAYVYKKINSKGETIYTIRYTNAAGESVAYEPSQDETFKENMSDAQLEAWYSNSALKYGAVDVPVAEINKQNTVDIAEAAKKALNGNVGSNANAYKGLTQDEINAVTAQLPGTENLQAYNQSKDANLFDTIYKNMQDTNPDLIERASLKDLNDLAGIVSDLQVGTTQRNIKNQQAQLLRQIQQDPELYNSIMQQLRADNAAGTIAGQRASNAQQIAASADATYDQSAADLYSNLFTGETAAAAAARNSVLGNGINASDQYIQSMLNNAMAAAQQGAISTQDLATFVDNLSAALDVDKEKYNNAAAENQAAADGKASDLIAQRKADLKTQLASNDAALQSIQDMLNVGTDYVQTGADVTKAINSIVESLSGAGSAGSAGGGFKRVLTPEYTAAEQFDNKQYTDFMNTDAFQKFLSDDTIDALTKTKTLKDIMGEFGLGSLTEGGPDLLTEEGMNALYNSYAEEANKQSNKVFNDAQRAYIAAVTAGDAKTTEQLTKLAANAGINKSNLYAASAFANQFKQQTGLGNTGRQLATDYQNQQAANNEAVASAATQANKALTGYLGSGNDAAGTNTLYGIKGLFDNTAAANRYSYGALGNKLMGTTQGLNNVNVSSNINNYDRLKQMASEYTAANADAGANNILNAGTKGSLVARVNAMLAQAGQ